ncbi:MAG: MerR family transcriptional regulator [Pseudonocardiaceae bacterium]
MVAAALSGATLRQLSYWRSSRSTEAPLLAPEVHRPRSRVSYSFRDVVALRTFVYLRSRDVSLQRVRKAVQSLREMGATEHLSSYRLVAVGRDVVWKISDDLAMDLTRRPGQQVIAQMVDILAAFRGMHDREVVELYRPKPGVAVDPEIRGGYPVIMGTRCPTTWSRAC